MIKNILIPTDGSEFNKVSLAYGIYLAKRFQAQITGLHVVDIRALEGPLLSDISGSLGFSPYQSYLPKFQKILEERGDMILEGFQGVCEANSVRPKLKRMSGVVSSIIVEETRMVDLLVIAQRGEHERWSNGLLGSTTESVVRRSPRPVLVTPGNFRELNNILVAYDGRVESNSALKTACEMFSNPGGSLKALVVSGDEKKCGTLTGEIKAFVEPYQISVDVTCVEGEVARAILDFAAKQRIDLIVMGAFGHSRIHDLILGGTSAYIIRNTTLPVLLNR
jgi:nucleotide-binding universal stress UspA family protein